METQTKLLKFKISYALDLHTKLQAPLLGSRLAYAMLVTGLNPQHSCSSSRHGMRHGKPKMVWQRYFLPPQAVTRCGKLIQDKNKNKNKSL